jgi:pyruvate/2-oxoacid:ferredoxin oxidoreductase alpha subunit
VNLFRPLPVDHITSQLQGIRRVGILDRDISPGLGGILWGETRALAPRDALVQNYILGLGGGDIRPEHLGSIVDELSQLESAGAPVIKEVA